VVKRWSGKGGRWGGATTPRDEMRKRSERKDTYVTRKPYAYGLNRNCLGVVIATTPTTPMRGLAAALQRVDGPRRGEPSSPINALYVARVLRTPGSHFEASTPLTSSHSARDSSAMKIGIRNAMFARSGATSSRKLLTT
jgi:hypothetical protein